MYNLIPINPFIIRGEIEHDRKKKAWIDEANGSKKGNQVKIMGSRGRKTILHNLVMRMRMKR